MKGLSNGLRKFVRPTLRQGRLLKYRRKRSARKRLEVFFFFVSGAVIRWVLAVCVRRQKRWRPAQSSRLADPSDKNGDKSVSPVMLQLRLIARSVTTYCDKKNRNKKSKTGIDTV